MKTTFREEDNNFVMEFEGRLDTVASLKTAEEMEVLYNSKGHDIILDLSKLEYISSSGLRLFLNLVKETRPNGRLCRWCQRAYPPGICHDRLYENFRVQINRLHDKRRKRGT